MQMPINTRSCFSEAASATSVAPSWHTIARTGSQLGDSPALAESRYALGD